MTPAAAHSATVTVTGHLVDTGILARILDDVLEYGGDYRIETLDLGRQHADESRALIEISAADADLLDRPDEHFEPPLPPPIPAPAPASLYAVLLVLAGVLLIAAPGIVRMSADVGLVVGVAVIAGGVALLVSRMRDRSDDDDDGAVV